MLKGAGENTVCALEWYMYVCVCVCLYTYAMIEYHIHTAHIVGTYMYIECCEIETLPDLIYTYIG